MNRIFFFIPLCLAFYYNLNNSFSQCIADGPKTPTVFVNDPGTGTIPWTATTNAAGSDNLRATAGSVVAVLSTSSTNYLLETGFGFTIPAAAVICGIQLDAERRQQGVLLGSTVKDNVIKIIKGGVITGTDHASATSWPGADAYISYGGSADLWGTTWTPADINAANFGIAYASASLNAGIAAVFLSAEIDNMRITVFYDVPLPIELTAFSASCEDQTIHLKWTTASESNNDYFTVEYSTDGIHFQEAGLIGGAGTSSQTMNYSFTHERMSKKILYYRLKQTDFNGASEYFEVIAVGCKDDYNPFLFPNPSSGRFHLDATGDLSIYNSFGEKIYFRKNSSGSVEIDLSKEPKGLYFYQLSAADGLHSGQLLVK